MSQVLGITTPGSAALEIAYAAMGRFDAFWSSGAKLDLWDIAAGITIAREADGMVNDLTGNPAPRVWDGLLVAHDARHEQLRELLSS
ncbi:inositol monophosphatase family protein [Halomonas kalidii]|uniref:Inositol monophosphatase family protein n=1 Tax=Halomonas kalidii TaxID=3043293 RepID=A0ABT6VRT2_9GAMM|nr:inositol monophosphatase family protein [Halomonas kalidii]MDI5936355.1 inositol monophosphatase family protein [Halomonas kalidii]